VRGCGGAGAQIGGEGGVTGATADAGARGTDGRGVRGGVDAGDGDKNAGAGMPSAEGQGVDGGRGRGVDAKARAQGRGRKGRRLGATESEGEGKQTPPLAFGAREGSDSMRKKQNPHPLAFEARVGVGVRETSVSRLRRGRGWRQQLGPPAARERAVHVTFT
jgi:hypothetical protein